MIYFSDFFRIDESIIDLYGAFNISLINDLPLFVDPFSLFGSDKEEYQQLHEKILEYIKFLRDKADLGTLSNAELEAWFFFNEVKQNWFGYSLVGNSGRGLAMKFAKNFSSTLSMLFSSIGKESVSQSSHIEKACLIQSRVGKDNISDFATNLIKEYLLDYTQKFAEDNLQPFQIRKVNVHKVYFDYKLEIWMSKAYTLPYLSGDYVILTPKDLLTKDDNWINRHDLDGEFSEICKSISNEQLRMQIQNYFQKSIPVPEPNKSPSGKDKKIAIQKVIDKFPEILDFYIKRKEDNKSEAKTIISESVEEVQSIFVKNVLKLVSALEENNFYKYDIEISYKILIEKIKILKLVIEEKEGYKTFYYGDQHIKKENELQIIQKLIWYASPRQLEEQKDYEAGFSKIIVNRGSQDKNTLAFKLASNPKIKEYLVKYVTPVSDNEIVETEEGPNAIEQQGQFVVVLFYFDSYELNNINSLINELKMIKNNNIILIFAGKRY